MEVTVRTARLTDLDSAVRRLEEELAGTTIDEAPAKIEDWFGKNPGAVSGVEPGEIGRAHV